MAYFRQPEDSQYHRDAWEALLHHIRNNWPQELAANLGELTHHIETKALYILTISRHLIEAAELLPRNGNWQPVFVEATLLLFPMIELVGQARLGNQPESFGSGIDWLRHPEELPRPGRSGNVLRNDNDRLATLGRYMQTLPSGPRVCELFHLRNYFTHGLKNQQDPNFDIGAVQTSMNYELPYAIVQQTKTGLAVYWDQLKNADGRWPQDWITRLAEADIYPFGIMGSPIYEKGLVDPNIIYWL